ncbi:MAG TPA: LysR family transcriptional regulator [Steroidobacteraceae bacterium]
MNLIRFRIDLPNGESIGPGKVELLGLVGRHGSISAAARAMNMSYRQAWLKLESLNRALDAPAFETVTGGSHGGGARLTAAGRELVARFRVLQGALESVAQRQLAPWVRRARKKRLRTRAKLRSARRPVSRRHGPTARRSKRRP